MKNREKPMGFWHHTIGGIPVASDKLMAELLNEQEKGITIADTSLLALNAGKITTRYNEESYPGHAAWLDWPYKLHRINLKNDEVRFELYNLEEDPLEKNDIYAVEPDRSEKMEQQLGQWLKSVVSSLNGDDYE